jgi:hypothetical protein
MVGFKYEQSSLSKEESMLLKFQMTAYAALLLNGLFVLPYVVEAVDGIENATDRFSCGESVEEVRNCLEAVISSRDATIDQLNTRLINSEVAEQDKKIEELQNAFWRAEGEVKKLQVGVGWWLKKLIRKTMSGCGWEHIPYPQVTRP